MKTFIIEKDLKAFSEYLAEEEKSVATLEKYVRDVSLFFEFAGAVPLSKELAVSYKAMLIKKGYKPRSVNSMLASLNSFFEFMGAVHCKVKSLKIQKQTYCSAI